MSVLAQRHEAAVSAARAAHATARKRATPLLDATRRFALVDFPRLEAAYRATCADPDPVTRDEHGVDHELLGAQSFVALGYAVEAVRRSLRDMDPDGYAAVETAAGA